MIIGTRAKPKVPPVEAGTYMAICVGIFDLGEQQVEYKGKTRYTNQIMFTFELSGVTVEIDGEQKLRQLSRSFPVSTSNKSGLRKFLTSWRGKAFSDEEIQSFNTDSLLGRSAMIQVVHNETGEYSNIDGVMQLPKGLPALTTSTELLCFNIDEWDDALFEKLPEWIQEKIKNSTQYQSAHAPETAVDFPAPATTAPAKAMEKAAAQHPTVTTQEPYEEEEECPF